MKCPKCGSSKNVNVAWKMTNDKEEFYKKYICSKCGESFYTVEYGGSY